MTNTPEAVHLDWTVDAQLRRMLNSGTPITLSPASAQGLVLLLDEYDRRGREITRLRKESPSR